MSSQRLILKSRYGAASVMDEEAAKDSVSIKETIDGTPSDAEKSKFDVEFLFDIDGFHPVLTVTLPYVNGDALPKVIEYCNKHAYTPSDAKEELDKFDTEFVNLDWNLLLDLLSAANYLGIPGLADIACRSIVDQMNEGKHLRSEINSAL